MAENLKPIDIPFQGKEALSRACSDVLEDILRQTYDEEDPCLTAPMKCSQEIQVDFNTNDLNDTAAKEMSDNEKKVESEDELCDNAFAEEEIILEPDNDFNSALRPQDQAHSTFSYRAAIDAVMHSIRGSSECVQIVQDLPVDDVVVLHPSRHRPRAQIPPNFNQLLNYLNSQGDNQSIENFGFRIFDNDSDTNNVTVNLTFSRYAKFVALILTMNTLLMLKIILWDRFFPFF